MKHPRYRPSASTIVLITAMVGSLFGAIATSSAVTPLDANLIANGDAEASPGAANYTDTLAPSGWTTTSNFTVVRYSAAAPNAGQLSPTESATFGGGANFFAGGPNNADSSASQVIDISDRAADVDSGQLTVVLSGYFGGISGQDDGMTLGAQLRNDKGQQYAATLIGNVRNAERQGASGLLYRSRALPVPVGTRSILVTLRSTRADTNQDTYNDGYADNVTLELIKTGSVNSFAQSFGNPATTISNPGQGFDYTNGIAPMPDGGVVVVGILGRTAQPGTGLYNFDTLIRYGSDGKILWQKEFPASGSSGASCFVTTDAQGTVYFASGFHDDSSGTLFPFVAKFDVNGVQQWFTNVKVPVRDIPGETNTNDDYINSPFTGMYLSPDGTLILGTGLQYVDGNAGVVIPGIVTVNAATGTPSCLGLNSTQGRDTTATGAAFAVCRSLTSGNFALLTGSPDRSQELVLVDPFGKTLATREAVAFDSLTKMIPTADGGFLVVGVGSNDGTILRKFGPDLSLQFQKLSYGGFHAFSVVQTPDGGYLLSARGSVQSPALDSSSPFYGKTKVFLVKLDSQGRLDRAEALGGMGDEDSFGFYPYPSAAVLTTDGGIALATSTTSYTGDTSGAPDWWVVKTDKLGRVANFQDLMIDVSTIILMRDADASNGYPPPGGGVGFDDPKPFALENPAQPDGTVVVPQSLNSIDPNGTTRVQAQAAFPAPPPPLHGGVGSTDFTVNGNYAAVTQNLADTVLHFAAQQTSHAAGLYVHVQWSTDGSNWSDLSDGRNGEMTYDISTQQFVLNTTNYPLQNGVNFRAVSSAFAYTISISDVVGPFNLASGKTHLGPTVLTGRVNGIVADLYFDVTESSPPPGLSLRVQSTVTPANEASWTDLADGNAGHMQQSTNPKYPNNFILLVNKQFPAADSVYFRAVAHLDGAVDGISAAIGPVTLTPDTPPTVTVTVTPPYGLSGSGTSTDPILVAAGTFNFGATVQSNRQINSLKLQVDGTTVASFVQGASSGATDVGTTILGDHVLEAVAVDDLGALSRAGTGALYIRVIPKVGSGVKGTGMTNADASTTDLSSGKVFVVANSGGDWSDPATWKDLDGNMGVPGDNDLAVIGAATVKISNISGVSVGSVTLNGGHIVADPGGFANPIGITHYLAVFSGSFDNVDVEIAVGAVGEMLNSANIQFTPGASFQSIVNRGTLNIHGSAGFSGTLLDFTNFGTVNFNLPINIPPNAAIDPAGDIRIIEAHSVVDSGIIRGLNPGALISQDGGGLVSQGGGNVVSHDGGTLVSQGGGNLVSQGGGNLVSQGGGNLVSQGGGNLVSQGGGNVISTNGSNIVGLANARAETTTSGFTQSGGETNLNAVSIIGPVTVNGGVLSGSGIIQGDLTNNAGYIVPGHSAGLVAVIGNFAQGANGTLIVENGGPYPSQFDQLQIGGTASLGGKLDIKLINGYTPDPADTFSPLGYSSSTGSFTSVSANAHVTVNASGLLASVDSTKPQPSTGQPLNIATRLQIQSGDNVLIGGFIITGPSGSTKKVLIRGLGPSLANFGVAGTLPDPFLELHKPDGSVVTNDNWKQAPNVAEIPAGFAPSNDLESIIYTTLSPGNYTAILKGAHGELGVGLVEAYDFDTASTAKLANIATRGFVNTGDNVMIGGFIIGGTQPANILVRAIGPSLIPFGVQGALRATTLELHDSNGSVISNDGWRSTQESEILATTIPPTNDNEAAILATLVPGNYTAIVRGKNNTTGIAVVEAYNLQ